VSISPIPIGPGSVMRATRSVSIARRFFQVTAPRTTAVRT
jgi:hypothetical protein